MEIEIYLARLGIPPSFFFLDIHQQKHTGTFRHVSPPRNIWRVVEQFAVKVGSIVIGHTIPLINCQIGWKQKPGQQN